MKLIRAKHFAWATVALAALVLLGCAAPQHRAEQVAEHADFARQLVTGKGFEHVVYEHELSTQPIAELHVYIGGDGTPWVAGRYPSGDPTPRQPLALKLMSEDPTPAIYLGRPCYLGLAASANCSVALWTSRRYAPEIVASMLSVIRQYQQTYRVKNIVLIGYSGGGTLAALLARDLQQNVFLLTVAANLDTDLWVELHGYLPLTGSLNPAHYRADTAHLPQLHLAGLKDEAVSVAVTRSYTAGLQTQSYRYYPTFDHSCCWLELWPDILMERPWSTTGGE